MSIWLDEEKKRPSSPTGDRVSRHRIPLVAKSMVFVLPSASSAPNFFRGFHQLDTFHDRSYWDSRMCDIAEEDAEDFRRSGSHRSGLSGHCTVLHDVVYEPVSRRRRRRHNTYSD